MSRRAVVLAGLVGIGVLVASVPSCRDSNEIVVGTVIGPPESIHEYSFGDADWTVPLNGPTGVHLFGGRNPGGDVRLSHQPNRYLDLDGDGASDALVTVELGESQYVFAWLWKGKTAQQVQPALGSVYGCRDSILGVSPIAKGRLSVAINRVDESAACGTGTMHPDTVTVDITGLWARQTWPVASALDCPRAKLIDARAQHQGSLLGVQTIRSYPDDRAPEVGTSASVDRYGVGDNQVGVPAGWTRVVFIPRTVSPAVTIAPCGYLHVA